MQKWWPSTFNLWPFISMETTIALHASIFCPHLRVYWWGQHRRSGIHGHTHHSRPFCLPHLGLHIHDRSYTPDTARGMSWQHYQLSCSYHSRRGELIYRSGTHKQFWEIKTLADSHEWKHARCLLFLLQFAHCISSSGSPNLLAALPL